MKKILALVLSLMMLCCCAAVAEEAAPEVVYDPAAIEALFEGEWVVFDDGVQLYVPAGWVELELTEDILATGTYYAIASEDGAVLSLAWAALEQAVTIEDAFAELSVTYPGASMIDNGAMLLVCYADAASDAMGYMAIDPAEPGVYTLNFSPMSNADLVVLSAIIASSWAIVPVEAEAAA